MAYILAPDADSTGFGATTPPNQTIILGFDQYEIVLAVTEDKRVLGVIEVREKKDFRNIQQKIASVGYIDVEQYVKD